MVDGTLRRNRSWIMAAQNQDRLGFSKLITHCMAKSMVKMTTAKSYNRLAWVTLAWFTDPTGMLGRPNGKSADRSCAGFGAPWDWRAWLTGRSLALEHVPHGSPKWTYCGCLFAMMSCKIFWSLGRVRSKTVMGALASGEILWSTLSTAKPESKRVRDNEAWPQQISMAKAGWSRLDSCVSLGLSDGETVDSSGSHSEWLHSWYGRARWQPSLKHKWNPRPHRGPLPLNLQVPRLKPKHNGFPSGVLATQPGGRDMVPEVDWLPFPLDLPLCLPLPLACLFCWSWFCSRLFLLLGLSFLVGNGMRNCCNSFDVCRRSITASRGLACPGSAVRLPANSFDALTKSCLSHSIIWDRVTLAKPAGWLRPWAKNKCWTHFSMTRKLQTRAWSRAKLRRWNAFRRSNSEDTWHTAAGVLALIFKLPSLSNVNLVSFFMLWISWALDVHSSGLIQTRTWVSTMLTQVSTNAWLGRTSGLSTKPFNRNSCSLCRACRSAMGSFLWPSPNPSETGSTFRCMSLRAKACDSKTSLLIQAVWNGSNGSGCTFCTQVSKAASVIWAGVVEMANAKDPKVVKPCLSKEALTFWLMPILLKRSEKAASLSRAIAMASLRRSWLMNLEVPDFWEVDTWLKLFGLSMLNVFHWGGCKWTSAWKRVTLMHVARWIWPKHSDKVWVRNFSRFISRRTRWLTKISERAVRLRPVLWTSSRKCPCPTLVSRGLQVL